MRAECVVERAAWQRAGSPAPTSGSERGLTSPAGSFWGRQVVRTIADSRHHGEGQHDQRDVSVPAVPRARLVVVKTEFRLGGLESVLDGPAPPLDGH